MSLLIAFGTVSKLSQMRIPKRWLHTYGPHHTYSHYRLFFSLTHLLSHSHSPSSLTTKTSIKVISFIFFFNINLFFNSSLFPLFPFISLFLLCFVFHSSLCLNFFPLLHYKIWNVFSIYRIFKMLVLLPQLCFLNFKKCIPQTTMPMH